MRASPLFPRDVECRVVLYAADGGQVHRPELHAGRRGGADDPRRARRSTSPTRSRRSSSAYEGDGEVKPELLQSVLEIATPPCADVAEAGRHVRRLRREVAAAAGTKGLCIGSAGTHPFALWEDQRVSKDPRYRDLIAALRFIARQEIIFGLHVHVGIDDAEKAIHVANGMRVHVPILLALSANSPYWRSDETGLASTRMPIFRAFPRVGIPPVLRRLGRLRAADRLHGRRGRDDRPHLPLVRRPPASEVRDRRGAGDGRPDPRRAHARADRADPGDGQGAGRALRGRQGARPLPVRDARREQVAGRPPRARGRARRPARAADGLQQGARAPALRPAARARPGPRLRRASSRGSSTCSSAARAPTASAWSTRPITTGRSCCARSWTRRERRNVAEGRGLVQPGGRTRDASEFAAWQAKPQSGARAGRVSSIAHGQRPGPVRRLPQLRARGVPVHHRMPVLRQPPAQARAEARARRHAEAAEAAAARARRWAA